MGPSITLSIEIELGWGTGRDGPVSETPLSEGREAETEYLERLLSCADEREIPITFDVVGHLLQQSCDGDHPGPYSNGWFDVDPATDVGTDPLYYAPDMVERIGDADTAHEIATHTYSHIHCETESDEALGLELERAAESHRVFGLATPTSIVMPYHESPSYEVLTAHDIDIIRTPFPDYSAPDGGIHRYVWNLKSPHPVEASGVSDGLIETYCTPQPSLTAGFLANGTRPPHREYQYLPVRLRQWLHCRSLVQAVMGAIEADAEIHLWTHLYNLSNPQQWAPIKRFLHWVADRRDTGKLSVRTMQDLAAVHT